jgi:hypothetical protein
MRRSVQDKIKMDAHKWILSKHEKAKYNNKYAVVPAAILSPRSFLTVTSVPFQLM